MKDLLYLLSPISYLWQELGLSLKVSHHDLESLLRIRQSDIVKLAEVLQVWMKTTEPRLVTWKTIISAIEGPLIGRQSLVFEICSFLAKGKFLYINQCIYSLHALWLYNN